MYKYKNILISSSCLWIHAESKVNKMNVVVCHSWWQKSLARWLFTRLDYASLQVLQQLKDSSSRHLWHGRWKRVIALSCRTLKERKNIKVEKPIMCHHLSSSNSNPCYCQTYRKAERATCTSSFLILRSPAGAAVCRMWGSVYIICPPFKRKGFLFRYPCSSHPHVMVVKAMHHKTKQIVSQCLSC